jgi:hypothetical protein
VVILGVTNFTELVPMCMVHIKFELVCAKLISHVLKSKVFNVDLHFPSESSD